MRFIHIADVHLGMQPDAGFPWSEERGESIWESFRRIIRLVGREKPDFLLIAGDLFQRQPLLRELKEVNDLFASIPETVSYTHLDVYKRQAGRMRKRQKRNCSI